MIDLTALGYEDATWVFSFSLALTLAIALYWVIFQPRLNIATSLLLAAVHMTAGVVVLGLTQTVLPSEFHWMKWPFLSWAIIGGIVYFTLGMNEKGETKEVDDEERNGG